MEFRIPSTKKIVERCPDCGNIIKDEFLEVDYVGCDGCPRIFERIKEND